MEYRFVFERKEIKYILTREQKEALLELIAGRMQPDEFGVTKICNIYFDNETFRVIRESIEKPKYKEKLRLRTYGVPSDGSHSFVELKKKLNGIVYKRRAEMPYADALRFLTRGGYDGERTQIIKEIEWVLAKHPDLAPAIALFYDRQAFFGTEDPNLRMTLDTNITYRLTDLDLRYGPYGDVLIDGNTYILELKTNGAVPLWLSAAFDKLKIYPGSYTKYGNAYKKLLMEGYLE